MPTSANDLPTSRHFTLQQLAEGVYAALDIAGAGAMSNAAIVDLGEATFIFDTFVTPQAAADLRAAAEHLTGRPVRYVVNSHRHGDHVFGNAAFDGAEIVATETTRERMSVLIPQSIAELRAETPASVRTLEESLAAETDAQKRAQLAQDLAAEREFLTALPALELRLPTTTFSERLRLHGTRRTVELLTYGGGHTESDAVALLPDDGILLTGDLVVIQNHPWLGHGDVVTWPMILRRLEQLDFTTLMPGHGPVGARTDIAPVSAYIATLLRLTNELLRAGADADSAAAAPIPEQYADLAGPDGFARNMRFLHTFVSERRGQEQV